MADIRTSPQLDNFNRADENPLSAGGLYRALGSVPAAPQLQNLANLGRGAITGTPDYPTSVWQSVNFTGGFEIWGVVAGAANNNDGWVLNVFGGDLDDIFSVYGYECERFRALGPDGWRIFRVTNGVATQIAGSNDNILPGVGALMLFRAVGDVLELWDSSDAGANWTLAGSVTDATYRTAQYLAPGVHCSNANQPAWSAWGGGQYPPRNVQLPYLGVGP